MLLRRYGIALRLNLDWLAIPDLRRITMCCSASGMTHMHNYPSTKLAPAKFLGA